MHFQSGRRFAENRLMRSLLYVLAAFYVSNAFAGDTVVIRSHEVIKERQPTWISTAIQGFDEAGNVLMQIQAFTPMNDRNFLPTSYSLGLRSSNGREYFSSLISKEEFLIYKAQLEKTAERSKLSKFSPTYKCTLTVSTNHSTSIRDISVKDCPQ